MILKRDGPPRFNRKKKAWFRNQNKKNQKGFNIGFQD